MKTDRQIQKEILKAIEIERVRQDVKYGGPSHDDLHTKEEWYGFVAERLSGLAMTSQPAKEYEYWIEIAALAVAALEAKERYEIRRDTTA